MNNAQDAEIMKGIGGKTGTAMWKEIDDLVTRWAKRNPRGANMNRLHNQSVRDELNDSKFGEWGATDVSGRGSTGTRLALSVHPELVNFIEAFYPDFFDHKENVRKFGRTYKMFRIPERQ